MATETPLLGLTDVAPSQAEPNVPINANMRLLEAVVQLSVAAVANQPAGGEADGARYIVGSAPAGAFAGFAADSIAYLANGAWLAVTPLAGWLAYNVALAGHYRFASGSPSGWIHVF